MAENKSTFEVRPVEQGDRSWMIDFFIEQWHTPQVVSRGRVHEAADLAGFVAVDKDKRIALATYHIDEDQCEIVTINSLIEGMGIGTELLKAVVEKGVEKKCKRAWAVTTNDNLNALRFFQTRGFILTELHRNAIEESRRLKPEIPDRGHHNIPIRDEIEVEISLV